MDSFPINVNMAGVCRLSLTSQQIVIEVVGEANQIVEALNWGHKFATFKVPDGDPIYLNIDHIWRVIPGGFEPLP